MQAEGYNLCNLFLKEAHGKLLGANGFVQVILEVSCGRLMSSVMGIALVCWARDGCSLGWKWETLVKLVAEGKHGVLCVWHCRSTSGKGEKLG